MATINEIANIDSYTGNAALGGYSPSAIQLDTKPIQQLAAYTFMYNKSQYDQRQKDADEKIKQLAALTNYDLVNGLDKDKQQLLNAQAKLIEYRREEAAKGTPSSPKEKMEREVEFLSKTAEQIKLINAAQARKIKLDAYKNEVQKLGTISAEEKELRIKQAEDLFNSTDVYTLPEIPNYDLTVPKIGETVYEEIQTFKEDANGNLIVDETRNEYSFTGNAKMGYLEGNDLMFPTLPKDATPQQQAEYEQKKLDFKKTKMGGWKDAAQFFTDAVNNPNYKKTVTTSDINVMGAPATTQLTEEIDIEKVVASNPIAGGLIQLSEMYNNAIKSKITRLEDKQYQSSITGKKPLFSQGQDTPESLRKLIIDPTKPLSAEQLASLARFEKARPDKTEMKVIETDDAIQRENQRLDFKVAWKNAETARINATKPDGGSDDKATETIDKPAILFGQHIDRLKTWFKDNPNKNLTVKYSSTDEKTRIATKLKPDQKIVYKLDGSYDIVDQNGVIAKGTIENLSQGFIEAVKASDIDPAKDKDGTMAEGFQRKSEAFFTETFGTTSGKAIWDGWDNKSAAPTTVTQTTTETTDDSKLTDAEYYLKYKKARN